MSRPRKVMGNQGYTSGGARRKDAFTIRFEKADYRRTLSCEAPVAQLDRAADF